MSGNIFINYRRDDTIATAGRIREYLAKEFGENRVFMDVDSIPVGSDFLQYLDAQLTDCRIFITLIGPRWTSAKDPAGRRRLDNADDYVRIELETALARGITIVPVLVDGAAMPGAGELPESLAPLATINAIEFRNTQFRWDAERLLGALREISGNPTRRVLVGRIALASAVVSLAAAGLVLYRFGGLGFPPPEMRAPSGFDSSEFRPDQSAPTSCDKEASTAPEKVPINLRGLANLALLKQAAATASSVIPGYPNRHRVSFLNDGWYNNCRSWVAASLPAWIEIDLGDVFEVDAVRLGSEHSSFWADRAPSQFVIATRRDVANDWSTVYAQLAKQTAVKATQEFSIQPQLARYVRVDIVATEGGDAPRIDEIEVYGRRSP